MKSKLLLVVAVLALTTAIAWGDQIVLKDGKEYSGKFVRGDASVIEFRVLGRVESFKTIEVDRVVFKEPELINPPQSRSTPMPAPEPAAPAQQVTAPNPQPEQDLRSQPPVRQVPPQVAVGPSVSLPAGTAVTIRTSEAIDTDRNRVGDEFDATLEDPLMSGNDTVAPRGTEVKGRIAYAKESGRVSGQSELIIELTEMKLNGRSYTLRTSDYSEVGASRGKRTAATAGGVAALGAIIGAVAGGGKGAAVGAATGAAVGTGVTVMTKGQTLKIPAETVLEFKLQSPLSIDVP